MILIHDNEILSIDFLPNGKKVIIKTKQTSSNRVEYVNIIFSDVYAYSFMDIGEENTIDEATENSPLGYLNWYYSNDHSTIHSEMEYGLPLPFVDKASAINALVETYQYYEINAYVGMDGWVIAKKWEIERTASHSSI